LLFIGRYRSLCFRGKLKSAVERNVPINGLLYILWYRSVTWHPGQEDCCFSWPICSIVALTSCGIHPAEPIFLCPLNLLCHCLVRISLVCVIWYNSVKSLTTTLRKRRFFPTWIIANPWKVNWRNLFAV